MIGKGDLVDAVIEKLTADGRGDDVNSHAQMERIMNATLDAIVDGVTNDGKVSIPGFGTFRKAQMAARSVRNPQTGEMMDVPSKPTVRFSAGSGFKRAVQ